MGIEDGAAGSPHGALPGNRHPVGDGRASARRGNADDLAPVGAAVARQTAKADIDIAVAESQCRPLLMRPRIVAGQVDPAGPAHGTGRSIEREEEVPRPADLSYHEEG